MVSVINAAEAKRLMEEDNALLVDIREADEYAREHVQGARLEPLSVLSLLPPDPDTQRTAIFMCHSGSRTADNTALLQARGFARACRVEGGLEGWKQAGLPVVTRQMPLPMPRQIQLGAGFMVFLFSLLSFALPGFTWLTLFVGAGLMFAGYSGICLMARVLARMPWNQTKDNGCGGSCATR